MKKYLVSFIKEDEFDYNFVYRFIEQENKLDEKGIISLSKDLKKHEKTERIIILNIINITDGV